ncbi:MAG: hypothetical protein F6K52_21585, partial [Moorea sp. SIO3H5]|nr:hypothetical protein [Moorena sp. SIO3H5]
PRDLPSFPTRRSSDLPHLPISPSPHLPISLLPVPCSLFPVPLISN